MFFDNIMQCIGYMLGLLNDADSDTATDSVSIVANSDIAIEFMRAFTLMCESDFVKPGVIIFDPYEYHKEYVITIIPDLEDDTIIISMEPAYSAEVDSYLSPGGYVLFHKGTDERALDDIQENPNVEMSGYDWFSIGSYDGSEE